MSACLKNCVLQWRIQDCPEGGRFLAQKILWHFSVVTRFKLNFSKVPQPPFPFHVTLDGSPHQIQPNKNCFQKISLSQRGGVRPNPTNPLDPPLVFTGHRASAPCAHSRRAVMKHWTSYKNIRSPIHWKIRKWDSYPVAWCFTVALLVHNFSHFMWSFT